MSDPGSDFHVSCPLSGFAPLAKETQYRHTRAYIEKTRDLTIVRSLYESLFPSTAFQLPL